MKYIIFIVVAGIIIWAAMMYRPGQKAVAPAGEPQATATSTPATVNTTNPINTTMDNGLKIEDVKVGTGAEAVSGKMISVHYVGTLDNGTKFDSSRDRGMPFEFQLGAGQVIQGWDQGFAGMKIGGIRKLTIPASLGYGDRANGPIPANSTLHFEVELLGVK